MKRSGDSFCLHLSSAHRKTSQCLLTEKGSIKALCASIESVCDRFRESISWSVVSDGPPQTQSTRHMCLGQVIVLLASPHASWSLPSCFNSSLSPDIRLPPSSAAANPWCSPNCILHPFLRAQSVSPPLSLIPDEGVMCLLFFGSFCSAEGLCLLRAVV